jgi:hypothetical protein
MGFAHRLEQPVGDTTSMTTTQTTHLLIVIGSLLLLYALIGNYVALPGYLRFLERGGRSTAGNALDGAVVIGAAKTILWMFSFQLGVLALAAAYTLRRRLYTVQFVGIGFVWLTLWAWPSLPAPGAWFYIGFGLLLLGCIGAVLTHARGLSSNRIGESLYVGSLVFFAFATWEVCGLGSTGRMLHPEQALQPIAHNLLITQSSKLMIEFVLAWGLLFGSLLAGRRLRPQ